MTIPLSSAARRRLLYSASAPPPLLPMLAPALACLCSVTRELRLPPRLALTRLPPPHASATKNPRSTRMPAMHPRHDHRGSPPSRPTRARTPSPNAAAYKAPGRRRRIEQGEEGAEGKRREEKDGPAAAPEHVVPRDARERRSAAEASAPRRRPDHLPRLRCASWPCTTPSLPRLATALGYRRRADR